MGFRHIQSSHCQLKQVDSQRNQTKSSASRNFGIGFARCGPHPSEYRIEVRADDTDPDATFRSARQQKLDAVDTAKHRRVRVDTPSRVAATTEGCSESVVGVAVEMPGE